MARRQRQFEEERRKKQKETIKEIEDAKNKNDEESLLYSFIEDKTNNSISDIENLEEDNQDKNE